MISKPFFIIFVVFLLRIKIGKEYWVHNYHFSGTDKQMYLKGSKSIKSGYCKFTILLYTGLAFILCAIFFDLKLSESSFIIEYSLTTPDLGSLFQVWALNNNTPYNWI